MEQAKVLYKCSYFFLNPCLCLKIQTVTVSQQEGRPTAHVNYFSSVVCPCSLKFADDAGVTSIRIWPLACVCPICCPAC